MAVSDKDMERLERRTGELEREVRAINLQAAARIERDKHIDTQITNIRQDVKGFASDFKWAARTVIGGVLLAFVAWVIQGGMAGAA